MSKANEPVALSETSRSSSVTSLKSLDTISSADNSPALVRRRSDLKDASTPLPTKRGASAESSASKSTSVNQLKLLEALSKKGLVEEVKTNQR